MDINPELPKIQNFIGGKLQEPIKQGYLKNFNPARGEVYSYVPDSTESDIEQAIESAKTAYTSWSQTPKLDRAGYLRKIASIILEKKEELALCESMDQGKPYSLALKIDIPRSAKNFQYFAEKIFELTDEQYESQEFGRNQVSYAPLGVVACISPWNLPLYLLTWKIAPALITGNTVVAKPSEVTPMTAYMLSQICIEADLPPGVLNIVHGSGRTMGDYLTGHKDIKAVSFTGSTQTGNAIYQNASKTFKKVSLEMGGKNPNIVFADCDFDRAISATMRSSFTNQGEVCTCGSRIYVEESIYEKFRDKLVEKANALVLGDPSDPKTQHGAMVSKEHYEKVLSYIDLAKEEGGNILCGGQKFEATASDSDEKLAGYFIAPTIIEGLSVECRTNQEEIFGPVVTITPFKNEEDALKMANSSEYGLAATIHTLDISKAARVAEKVESGMIWINDWMVRDLDTPFGGVKNSGLGREGGLWGLKFFSQVKNTCFI